MIILLIILFTPILLNKTKIPQLLGLIIAGAVIGPNGLNLMERDSGIILSGTAGLLYIMFLAGLEIDLVDFKRNRTKSFVFGMYTFIIPMILGLGAGLYLLDFSIITSVLLASMFASHTLIAYPIIRKAGITSNRAVNITVGGTMVTDILALLVLAVIVGITEGEVNTFFWLKLTISTFIAGSIILFIFPLLGRWFFQRFEDNVLQYVFVLACLFLGAFLAEMAGIEGIIGAFLTGIAFNGLISRTSPLMNRVEFVGSAIFIPFFLIGIGMLLDYRVFFKDLETLKVGLIMIIVATAAKFMAAWLTQKTFHFSADERRIIFGLSNAQAAATLAAVVIGYNIIIGTTVEGEPQRLLNENVLNGTILMILFTCTAATFVAQKGAKNIAAAGVNFEEERIVKEKILIPVRNAATVEELINLAVMIKSRNNRDGVYALTVISNNAEDLLAEKQARKLLTQAAVTASATDTVLNELLRYDLDLANGINNIVKEQKITDLILGLHVPENPNDSFLGKMTESIMAQGETNKWIYNSVEPLSTIRKHIVWISEAAEAEYVFSFWLEKLGRIVKASGAKIAFCGPKSALKMLKSSKQMERFPGAEFKEITTSDNFEDLPVKISNHENLIVVLGKNKILHGKIILGLKRNAQQHSFILVSPRASVEAEENKTKFTNPSIFLNKY
ncbi:cation:proton antiporter [Zunongwangia sp. H14]|uniref:cation:proton antiporter n=1 Tax=Zunongwangia sp. H14 TaxID=3240792 RepID=UPI00356293D4